MVARTMKRMTSACARAPRVSMDWIFIAGTKKRPLATMLLAALAIGLPSAGVNAMNIHVNGSQVFLSGDVAESDLYVLADVVERLRKQGRNIDTLVMRNSLGGDMYAGYSVGDFARRHQLNTVASGYCISACSMMFVGGSTRAFASDQPLKEQFIGIHGASLGHIYSDSSRNTPLYRYFLQAIAAGDPRNTDTQLLDDAFGGLDVAKIYDPASNRNPSVFWCHSDCDNPSQYKAYVSDDVYNLGFITQHSAAATTDTLTLSKDASGDVNPHFYNAYDPAAKPYVSDSMINFFSQWNPLTWDLAYDAEPALTYQASLDDIEVRLYNQLTPADRRRLLLQYVQQRFLSYETLDQFNAHMQDPQSFESALHSRVDEFSKRSFVDSSVLSVNDAYGVIKVTNNATWTLARGQRGAADALLIDHGRLLLEGGVLNINDSYIYNRGRLEGYGSAGEAWRGKTSQYSNIYVSDGGIVHPSNAGLDFNGQLVLDEHAILSLDVTPKLAGGLAPLRFGISVNTAGHYAAMGWLKVASESASLALNVAPAFYRPGMNYNLIGYSNDLSEQIAALKSADIPNPDENNIVSTRGFHVLARADSNGDAIATSAIDPRKTLFHPFEGSLIDYKLIQTGFGIWLQPTDPFTDTSLCGNRGCGLGTALSSAAQSTNKAWEPLLGALEFSTTDQASHAAKQLRGESYGSLRTSTLSLLGTFGTTLNQHLRAVDPGADQAAQVALAASAYGMGLNDPRHAGDLSSMMRYLVANDDAVAAAKQDADKFTVWGRVFGQRGRLDSGDDADGLRQHTTGVMFGLDRKLNAGTVLGGSVGYGKLRADGEDGSGFRGKVQATDARLYVDHRYDHGYLDASVSFTHLRNSTTRAIQLPLYSTQAKAQYGGNAWSLHFEHGKTFQDHHGVMWQPILPSIDVTRLPAMQFVDRGAGPANLEVNGKRRFDPRIGVGLQVAKSFSWGTHGNLTPHARVLFQHRFINNENEFVANLQGDPTHPFDVASQQEDRNHTLINAGLSARRGQHTAFMLDYNSDYSRRHHDHGVMLGVSHRW